MGVDEFHAYYRSMFGDRWEALSAALLSPNDPVEYSEGLVAPYRLDSASVRAAKALRLPERGEVLDACAAPGGKSLVLASRLGTEARLVSNELSGDRRRRLVDVLDSRLEPGLRARVAVSGFDAAVAGGRASERGRFSAILLDAPCSSERHVIRDQAALARWTQARVRFIARRQWSLLSSAFLMLAPGGSLVYSTCALSPDENDGPMERLFEKYRGEALDDPLEAVEGAERTVRGVMYLPDEARGAGPLYIARVSKRSITER